MPMSLPFTLDGTEHAVSIAARRPTLVVTIDGEPHEVSEAGALNDDCVLLTVDGRSYQVWRAWEGNRVHVRIGGRTFSVGYDDPITAAHLHAGGDDVLRADMPGVVVSVDCEAGQHVATGDVLMVIESMKMQINIVAPRDGTIEHIHLSARQSFDKGAELIALHEES